MPSSLTRQYLLDNGFSEDFLNQKRQFLLDAAEDLPAIVCYDTRSSGYIEKDASFFDIFFPPYAHSFSLCDNFMNYYKPCANVFSQLKMPGDEIREIILEASALHRIELMCKVDFKQDGFAISKFLRVAHEFKNWNTTVDSFLFDENDMHSLMCAFSINVAKAKEHQTSVDYQQALIKQVSAISFKSYSFLPDFSLVRIPAKVLSLLFWKAYMHCNMLLLQKETLSKDLCVELISSFSILPFVNNAFQQSKEHVLYIDKLSFEVLIGCLENENILEQPFSAIEYVAVEKWTDVQKATAACFLAAVDKDSVFCKLSSLKEAVQLLDVSS